jgi:hypothetical protein
MKSDFSNEMVFGFTPPNFCLLGNEDDFKKLAESILDLTSPDKERNVLLSDLNFINNVGEVKTIIFSSRNGADSLGVFRGDELLFELDARYWERLFKFFVMMSWDKKTYYFNSYEDCLRDLPLNQDCHFICSSEF